MILRAFNEDEWETGRWIGFRESSRQRIKSWSVVAIIGAANVCIADGLISYLRNVCEDDFLKSFAFDPYLHATLTHI